MRQTVVCALSAFAVAACQTGYAREPQSVGDAVRRMQSGLTGTSYLNESDLLSDESNRRFASARRFIEEAQCSARSANPMVLIGSPVDVSLKGSVQQSGAIRFQGTDPAGNFSVPLRAASLSNVPNEYLREMAALTETRGVPPEIAQKLKSEVEANYNKLSARINTLIDRFEPRACGFAPYATRALDTFVPPTY